VATAIVSVKILIWLWLCTANGLVSRIPGTTYGARWVWKSWPR